jgi:hypothetical protein
MQSLANAFSVALLLTAFFAFRHQLGRRPGLLAVYFALFMGLEWVGEHYFIPAGAFGAEIAAVCLVLSVPFLVATWLSHRRGGVDASGT